jgi:hypothetical protein
MNKFFIGLHHPSTAWPFLNCMLSINSIRGRLRAMRVNNWILDSGAFTEISTHGRWRTEPEYYAEEINQWALVGNLKAAVSQDMMCEPFILKKTGLSVEAHQEITIKRYLRIRECTDAYVMPVLQGYDPGDYARHIVAYGEILPPEAWVGVGSVCKRNTSPSQIEDVLFAIKSLRPGLRLHGFGLKLTALKNGTIRDLLETCDSMAWSYHERKNGRGAHDPRGDLRYAAQVQVLIDQPVFVQPCLFQWWQS